ncbi:hypothetical protein [Arenibaculum pallidiluteum]|uniref:hypothetical protein n=1 Tax=Arenibaculum pallidiluteum TaxID=2812559 RepID=UPI001A95D335|nr:hypothetical protein [Arenibaculum pallidiluteum]
MTRWRPDLGHELLLGILEREILEAGEDELREILAEEGPQAAEMVRRLIRAAMEEHETAPGATPAGAGAGPAGSGKGRME